MDISYGDVERLVSQHDHPRRVNLGTSSYIDKFQNKDSDSNHGDVAELFHENSKYQNTFREFNRTMDEFGARELSVLSQTEPDYRGRELIELPEIQLETGLEIGELFKQRRSVREYTGSSLSMKELSQLLSYAAGRSGRDPDNADGENPPSLSRTYPSAGGLYPIELYVLVFACDGLDPGLYYYVPGKHGLRILERDESYPEKAMERFDIGDDPVDYEHAAVVFAMTASFWRTKIKYGSRGYRFTLQESGHLAQNIELVCEALGLGSVPIGGYQDEDVNDLLGVNGVDEAVVYLSAIGDVQEVSTNG